MTILMKNKQISGYNIQISIIHHLIVGGQKFNALQVEW